MDIKETYQVKVISERIAVVISTSYVNPVSYLPSIEEDLSRVDFSGKILFDLLLSNGYASNRFIKADVNKAKVDRFSMKVADSSDIDKSLIEATSEFYKSNPDLVEDNEILLDREKRQLIYN